MILSGGQTVSGKFVGFDGHRFVLATDAGSNVAEFASGVQSIHVAAPVRVAAQFVARRFENVEFTGYSQFKVRLVRGADEVVEPVTLLRGLQVAGRGLQAESPASEPPTVQPVPASPAELEVEPDVRIEAAPPVEKPRAGEREWQRTGRWREQPLPAGGVISRGEDIDLEQALDKQVANVVHFHLPSALASVRQGGYLATLAARRDSRFVVKRVEVPNWDAPICAARGLKSLPQFWFYSRSGRLVGKLVTRFTEADIDALLQQTLRAN